MTNEHPRPSDPPPEQHGVAADVPPRGDTNVRQTPEPNAAPAGAGQGPLPEETEELAQEGALGSQRPQRVGPAGSTQSGRGNRLGVLRAGAGVAMLGGTAAWLSRRGKDRRRRTSGGMSRVRRSTAVGGRALVNGVRRGAMQAADRIGRR